MKNAYVITGLCLFIALLLFLTIADIYTRKKYNIPLKYRLCTPWNNKVTYVRSEKYVPERDGYLQVNAQNATGSIVGHLLLTLAVANKVPVIIEFEILNQTDRHKGVDKGLLLATIKEIKSIDPEIRELSVNPIAADGGRMPQEEAVKTYKHLAAWLETNNADIKLVLV